MSLERVELAAEVQEAASRLLHAYTRLGPALKALHEHSPGFPSGLEPPASTPSEDGEPDQQPSQPERWEDMAADEAVRDLKKLRGEIHKAYGAAATVYDLCVRWGVPTAARQPDDAPEGACVSCWRNRHHYEPTAAGRYAELCRFCGDFARDYRQHPPLAVLREKHRGQRVTVNLIEKHLPKRKKAS